MGTEASGAGGRRAAGARRRRWPRPVSSRPSASPFSAGRARPPPPKRATRPTAARSPPCSLLAALCLARRHLAGLRSSMRWRRSLRALLGAHMPAQASVAWLSIVPVAASRSSYNGLLVFLLHGRSRGMLAAYCDPSPRLATAAPRAGLGLRLSRSSARRRNIPPRASRSRSGACSAPSCSRARSTSTCRRPAIMRPARLTVAHARSDLGCPLRADRRRASASPPTASIACSS